MSGLAADNQRLSESSFERAAIAFLASIALADGYLRSAEYERYGLATRDLMLDKLAADPGLQSFALRTLLKPESITTSASNLLRIVAAQQVAPDALVRLVRAAFDLAVEDTRQRENILSCLEQIVQSLGERGDAFAADFRSLKERWQPSEPSTSKSPTRTGWLSAILSRAGEMFLLPSQTPFELASLSIADQLAQLSSAVNDTSLAETARGVLARVKENSRQTRYVIAGEMKHGKSSLFNSLLGRAFSPVGESVATTSTTVEVSYGAEPTYGIDWLDRRTASDALMRARANGARSMIAYAERIDALLQDETDSERGARGIQSLADLPDFVAADGAYTPAVSRVRIDAPVSILSQGAILIDTPGLNDAMQLREEATLKAALSADVLIFVMRADRLGTESERRFLRSIHDTTHVRRLVFVVTHVDRISAASGSGIETRLRAWIADVCGDRQVPTLFSQAPIFLLDGRSLRSARTDQDDADGLRRVLAQHPGRSVEDAQFRQATIRLLDQVTERLTELAAKTERAAGAIQHRLGRAEALNARAADARAKAQRASEIINRDRASVVSELNHQVEKLTAGSNDALSRLRDKLTTLAEQEIISLGGGYTDEARWKPFMSSSARTEAAAVVDAFQDDAMRQLKRLRERAERFNEGAIRIATDASEDVRSSLPPGDIEALMPSLWFSSLQKRAEDLASAGRTLAVAGTGSMVSLAYSGNMLTRSLAVVGVIGSAKLVAVGAIAAGLSYVGLRSLASPDGKAEVRRKMVEAVAAAAKERLDEVLREVQAQLSLLSDTVSGVDASIHKTELAEANARADEAELVKGIFERMEKDERQFCENFKTSVASMKLQISRLSELY